MQWFYQFHILSHQLSIILKNSLFIYSTHVPKAFLTFSHTHFPLILHRVDYAARKKKDLQSPFSYNLISAHAFKQAYIQALVALFHCFTHSSHQVVNVVELTHRHIWTQTKQSDAVIQFSSNDFYFLFPFLCLSFQLIIFSYICLYVSMPLVTTHSNFYTPFFTRTHKPTIRHPINLIYAFFLASNHFSTACLSRYSRCFHYSPSHRSAPVTERFSNLHPLLPALSENASRFHLYSPHLAAKLCFSPLFPQFCVICFVAIPFHFPPIWSYYFSLRLFLCVLSPFCAVRSPKPCVPPGSVVEGWFLCLFRFVFFHHPTSVSWLPLVHFHRAFRFCFVV